METTLALIPILAVLVVGIISPGPSFILVARTAVAVSRPAAIASAFGMAAGASLLATVALLGLNTAFRQIPGAYVTLKIIGGTYLLYLAYQTWRGAGRPVVDERQAVAPRGGLVRHFGLALGTMVSNPKAAVQYGVIFAAMLPRSPSTAVTVALPIAVFALEASWYILVALALSAPATRSVYLRAKLAVDRVAGAVLAALGIKLLLSTR
jgi:threonine/homoserine/homoserine lactone efflux protein